MTPKISIVTPSFNQGQYIEKTICSVLDQQYPNLEYIIIDGGSTDQTVEIIKKYEDRLTYWVSERDKGQTDALNKGFSKATGDIYAWINSDDWYEKGVFQQVAQSFRDPSVKLVIGDCMLHNESNVAADRLVKPAVTTFESMLRYWKDDFLPPQPSIFVAGDLMRKVLPLDENLKYAMDMDLWLRLTKDHAFSYTGKLFSYYLIHNESKTGGGFNHFMPEWKMLSRRHLKRASSIEKIRFYLAYSGYMLRYAKNAVKARIGT